MPRPKSDLIKVNLYADPTTKRAMEWLAAKRGSTYSELTRIASREWVVAEIKKETQSIEVVESVPRGTPEPTPPPNSPETGRDESESSAPVASPSNTNSAGEEVDDRPIGPIRRANVPSGKFQVTPG